MVRHLQQGWHRVQPHHVMPAGQPPPVPTLRRLASPPSCPSDLCCPLQGAGDPLPGPSACSSCRPGAMRAQSRERAQPPHRLPSSPGFWKLLPLPGALVLPPHSCILPTRRLARGLLSPGRAYCPGLSSPAACSVGPFLQAEGDCVPRGSGTSVTVVFVRKGAGASEQSGG